MSPRSRLGDRRRHLRFDVTGQLWASIDIRDAVVLRNIAVGGALVEARLAPAMKTIRTAQILLRQSGPPLNVVVRHLRPVASAENRFLVGVEFVDLSASDRRDLEQFVREWHERAGV